MKRPILPQTRRGTWAVGFFLTFFALGFAGSRISAAIGNTIEYPNPIDSPLLGSVIYLTFLSAILASILGIIAVKRDQEKACTVLLSIPLGFAFLILLIVFFFANLLAL